MKRVIALILILPLLSTAGAFAQQRPTLPFYWVTGTVADAGGAPLGGREITLHKETNPDQKRSTVTGADGKFRINAYELHFYHNIPINFAADQTYVVTVSPVDGVDAGVNQAISFSVNQGFYQFAQNIIPQLLGVPPVVPPADVEAPTVTGTIPPVDGRNNNIPVNQSVSFIFSERIGLDTLDFTCNPDVGAWVLARVEVFEDGKVKYTFTHNDFANDTLYSISINAVADQAGNALVEPYTFQFTTVAAVPPLAVDNVAPTIDFNNITPGKGAIDVAVDQPIIITFAEAMDTDPGDFTVTCVDADGRAVALNPAWNAPQNTVVTLTHADFANGPQYTVTVDAARDVAGNALGGPNSFAFTTVAAPPAAGTVSLTISRIPNSKNIRIGWEGANPDLYYLIGNGSGSYNNVVENWTAINFNALPAGFVYNAGEVFITHTNQMGEGNAEVYYKGLVAGTRPGDEHEDPAIDGTYLANASTAAKFNVQIPANGLSLLAIAVRDGNASNIFPAQLGAGETLILYPRSGQGLDRVSANSAGLTGADFVIAPTVGFWAENPRDNPITITFVGAVLSAQQINLDGLDLTGNPLPISIPSARIGGKNSDSVYLQSGMGLDKVTRIGGQWRGDEGFNLGLDQGFWYEYGAGNRRWDIDLKAGKAQMEEF